MLLLFAGGVANLGHRALTAFVLSGKRRPLAREASA